MTILNHDFSAKDFVRDPDVEYGTWSVEIDANSYADDLYNGTYEEALAYAKSIKADYPDVDVKIVLVSLTED